MAALSTYIPNLADPDALRQLKPTTPRRCLPRMANLTMVPLALGQQAVAALRQRQQPISWRTYPMMHAVCEEEISELGRWLNTVLRAHPA